MSEKDKNIVSKLEIIKAMAVEASVKQIADVFIDYITSQNKELLGFKTEKKT